MPLQPLDERGLTEWKKTASESAKRWVEAAGFKAAPGQSCAVPGDDGGPRCWLFGREKEGWLYQLAALPAMLPRA